MTRAQRRHQLRRRRRLLQARFRLQRFALSLQFFARHTDDAAHKLANVRTALQALAAASPSSEDLGLSRRR